MRYTHNLGGGFVLGLATVLTFGIALSIGGCQKMTEPVKGINTPIQTCINK